MYSLISEKMDYWLGAMRLCTDSVYWCKNIPGMSCIIRKLYFFCKYSQCNGTLHWKMFVITKKCPSFKVTYISEMCVFSKMFLPCECSKGASSSITYGWNRGYMWYVTGALRCVINLYIYRYSLYHWQKVVIAHTCHEANSW